MGVPSRSGAGESWLVTVLWVAAMIVLGCATSRADQVPDPALRKVLFIGNSYTGFNKLPQVFREVAASAGNAPLEVKASIQNGKRLDQHLGSAETLGLIDEGDWSVVIVQPQSEEAALSEEFPEVRSRFLTSASGLYDRIKAGSPRAVIVFYQTWARHADYWKDSSGRAVGNSPADMQARNRKWNRNAVEGKMDCVIAPVGDAWEMNYRNPGAVRLHKADNSHPNFSGSYLAALVIYGAICHPPDLEIPYEGALSHPEAAYLQAVAARAIQPLTGGKPSGKLPEAAEKPALGR